MSAPTQGPDPLLRRSESRPVILGRAAPHPDHGTQTPSDEPPHGGHGGHNHHRLMMLVCCIPMIVIAGLLVATGAAGSGALLWALGCLAMMAMMMLTMPGGHTHK